MIRYRYASFCRCVYLSLCVFCLFVCVRGISKRCKGRLATPKP